MINKKSLLIFGFFVLTVAALFVANKHNTPVDAVNQQNQGLCALSTEDVHKIEDPGLSETWTAPCGKIITKVYIKAGSDQSGAGCFTFSSDENNGCYSVSGIGTRTITVEKVGSGPSCKDISHLEIVLENRSCDPTPTPTTQPTCTPTPIKPTCTPTPTSVKPTCTPTPTEVAPTATPTETGPTPTETENNDPTPTPTTNGEITPTPESTATPTQAASPTETPTPTPTSEPGRGGSDNNTQSSSSSSDNTSSSSTPGQVLGYAGTGVVENTIMDLLGLSGALMTAGGIFISKKKIK